MIQPQPLIRLKPHLENIRGISRKIIKVGSNVREFNITRAMLPMIPVILLFLQCFCVQVIQFIIMHICMEEERLGIQVFYLGGCDVNINKIYFATAHARDLYFGKMDYLITSSIQTDLTYFTADSFSSAGIKPFRFYTRDEDPTGAYYGAIRYLNKLIGNVTTTQATLNYPELYEYYTNAPDNRVETQRIDPIIAVPFFKNYSVQYKSNLTLGMATGYEYTYGTAPQNINDTVNSGYETHLRDSSLPAMDNASIAAYLSELGASYCFQKFEENFIYDYVLDEKIIPLYSNKPWWGELFVGSDFDLDTISINPIMLRRIINYNRPKTGEEIKLGAWIDLLLG